MPATGRTEPRAHRRAEEDLANDRHWKARDRLDGYLAGHPSDQATLNALGEVCFAQHDLPAAGRYWYLTARDDESARAARAALHERSGNRAATIIAQLTPRAPIHDWPPPVQDRLHRLQDGARRDGFLWEPTSHEDQALERPVGWRDRLEEAAVVGFILLGLVGVWLVGLVAVGVLAWRLFT